MDAPPRSSKLVDAPSRMSRMQSGIVWLVIVAGSFGVLLIAAYAAFSSQSADDRSVYAYQLSDLEPDVRDLTVVTHIPETARDIRLIWNPETGAAAAAWNAPADAAAPEGCEPVADPTAPAFAERIIRLGTDPHDGLACGDVIIATRSGGTYAWTVGT